MISIIRIECGEVHLEVHSIFIGIQTIIGGIGEVIVTSCTVIGIDSDCMDTIDGHHLDMIDGDTTTFGVGVDMDIMDMDSTIGVGETEWMILLGNIEKRGMLHT